VSNGYHEKNPDVLSEDLFSELRQRSEQEHVSIPDVVRSAVRELLSKEKEKNWVDDPLCNMIGAGSSNIGDLSSRHDDYRWHGRESRAD
jgi:Arc/MetJ-type ribon-helix-helix transcriptional regulator